MLTKSRYYHWLGDGAEDASREQETLEQLARELPFVDATVEDG